MFEERIRSSHLSYLQLEFLFAEMIRRLKANEEQWPEEGELSKARIYEYLWTLLGNWDVLVALGPEEDRKTKAHDLTTVILIHLLRVDRITGFELVYDEEGISSPQQLFLNSSYRRGGPYIFFPEQFRFESFQGRSIRTISPSY